NASGMPPRGRAPSLISKVTGLGRLLGGTQPQGGRQEPAEPRQPQAAMPRPPAAARPQPVMQPPVMQQPAVPQPQPAMPPLPRTAASQPRSVEPRPAPAQPRLNLDPADRRTSMADEHLLDIPAFLRRQAN